VEIKSEVSEQRPLGQTRDQTIEQAKCRGFREVVDVGSGKLEVDVCEKKFIGRGVGCEIEVKL
jgi:hypothetical protein